MFLEAMPSGRKVFRLAYRYGGKQRTLVIGGYPNMRLADARLKAAEHKSLLRNDVDPNLIVKDDAAKSSDFAAGDDPRLWRRVVQDYLKLRQQNGAAPRTMTKLDRQVNVNIKALGNQMVGNITSQDILDIVIPIADKGYVETAYEIRSRFSQIFRYAVARGMMDHDPAAVTIDAMVKRRRGEFSGITNPRDVGLLMCDIGKYKRDNALRSSCIQRHNSVTDPLLLAAISFFH